MFLRIYRARKAYRPRAKFSTWLFTIANNLALNHLRGKGRNPSVALGWGTAATTGTQPRSRRSPRLVAATEPRRPSFARSNSPRWFARRLDELVDDQKIAVLLNKFEDMSYAEIAEVMGRSEAAVKSLLAAPGST